MFSYSNAWHLPHGQAGFADGMRAVNPNYPHRNRT